MSISVQIFSLSILDFIVLYSGFYSKETVVQLDLLGKHTSIYNPASPLLFSTPHFIRSGYGYDRIGINMLVSPGTSLVVQCLRLLPVHAGSILGEGAKILPALGLKSQT